MPRVRRAWEAPPGQWHNGSRVARTAPLADLKSSSGDRAHTAQHLSVRVHTPKGRSHPRTDPPPTSRRPRRSGAPATPTRRHRWRSLWNGRDRHLQELADVGFLADCTLQQRERIASLTTTLDVSAGRRLCRAGVSDRQFLVIVEGEATITVDGAHGATLGPGCSFGAVAVLTSEGRRGAAVTAATPMTLLVLHRVEFHALAKDVPVIARRVQHETACRLAPGNSKQHPAGTAPPQSGTGGALRGVPERGHRHGALRVPGTDGH